VTILLRYLTRAWVYFRMGYATYLTFLLGYFSTLVTVYYLAIKNMPALLDIFPHFVPFAMLATAIGAPLAVIVGWVHMKRSSLYSAERDIGVEASPYNYKLPGGYWNEVVGPLYLELLTQHKRLLDSQKSLTNEERVRIESLEYKLETLIRGGLVGTPRRSKI
jgi:hypothetical protein